MSVSAIGTGATTWPLDATRQPRPDMTKMMEPVAKALGMSDDDLKTQLASGKTLNDLAQEKGVSKDDLLSSIEQGLGAAPDGAPALSQTQLTQMATRIAAGKHHHHGHGGKPPADASSATDTGSVSRAQSNLDKLAKTLGIDPSQLMQALVSGLRQQTPGAAPDPGTSSPTPTPTSTSTADGASDDGSSATTDSSTSQSGLLGSLGLNSRWRSDLTQLDGGLAVDEYA